MRYRATMAIVLALASILLVYNTPHNNGEIKGDATQLGQLMQPSPVPTQADNRSTRPHNPEPLPQEMQRPIASGLLITFFVVIGVILLHRARHPRPKA